jgi:hypothetical protein
MAKPDQFLVVVSRVDEAAPEKPCETLSAHSVEVTEDGSLSIRGQNNGRFLTHGLWDRLEVKRLGELPMRNRQETGSNRQEAWAGDWFD